MVKKRRNMLIAGLCAFLLLVGLGGVYLYEERAINISMVDCEPKEGMLLAYIDGKPYYFDTVLVKKYQVDIVDPDLK